MDIEFVFHFTGSWRDVQEKAKAIRDGGYVRVISASPQYLVGEVRGDTNIYQTTLMREPGSQRIALWDCGCAWAAYSWGRSGRWKKFEGRVCSHALALNYEGQSRGWGGQVVQEDESFPLWQSDPSITVKVPGDYKKPEIGQWRLDASLSAAKSKGDVQWSLPKPDGKGYYVRPFAYTTISDSDSIMLLGEQGLTWGEAVETDWLLSSESRSVIQRFVDEGYGDQPISNFVRSASKMAARAGVDYCKYCGSDELFDAAFDEEGFAQTDGTGEWMTVCQDCGEFQTAPKKPRRASTDPSLHEAPAVAVARDMFAQGASESAVLDAFKAAGVFNAPTIINKLRGAPKVQKTAKDLGNGVLLLEYHNQFVIVDNGMRAGQITWETKQDKRVFDDEGWEDALGDSNGYYLEVDALFVDPEFRRKGYGTILLNAFREMAERGVGRKGWSPGDFTADGAAFWRSYSGEEVPTTRRINETRMFEAAADSVDGVMVAIRPPDHLLDLVHIEGGEPYDNLHLTVAYLGKSDEVNHDDLESTVATWASRWGELPGQLAGYGVFENGDSPVLYVAVDCPGLDRARDDLIDLLAAVGIALPDEHGFDPHLTLQYEDFETPESMPDGATEEFTFGSVYVVYGQEWIEFELGGDELITESSLSPKVATQLSGLSEEQLRALLLMAQREGQSLVEGWVRDAMRSRGYYAGRTAHIVVEGMMGSETWLAKALAIILAGGILLSGGATSLPVIDQIVNFQPNPIVQVVQQQTQEQAQMIVQAESDFRAAGLKVPRVQYEFTDTCRSGTEGNYNAGTDRVQVCSGEYGTLIHELGHAWADQYMTSSAKQAFAERMGYDSWGQGQQQSWSDRPGERVAQVIKWKVTGGGHNGIYQDFYNIIMSAKTVEAELKDEPEPALPETTAEEESLAVEPGEGEDSRSWILSDSKKKKGGDDMNIAAAARAHLALAKTAVKTFSVAEQQELIDEGEDVEAANLDRLDIEGTHYESLEAAHLMEEDEDWLW